MIDLLALRLFDFLKGFYNMKQNIILIIIMNNINIFIYFLISKSAFLIFIAALQWSSSSNIDLNKDEVNV